MINLDSIVNDNNKKHKNWPYVPDHPYRILIISGSGSGKRNTLLNLINEQRDIDEIYLYAKDLSEPKDDVYENIDHYNPNRKRKVLIVFDDMIADIMTNKKFQSIIKELFIRFY